MPIGRIFRALGAVVGLTMAVQTPLAADVLADAQKAGVLRCAVGHTPGFGGYDGAGRPTGFEADLCRAVAAAVLGSAGAARTEALTTAVKYTALTSRDVDIAFGMATWTYTRDTGLGVRFVIPALFDGQGFLSWSDTPDGGIDALRGARVCVQEGTTSLANLESYDRRHGLEMKIVKAASSNDRAARFVRRDCDIMTGDRSQLATQRIANALEPSRWRLHDDTISREPLGPYVVGGDERWFSIVRWVINVTQIAEQRGITAANVAAIADTDDLELRRLAGLDKGFGQALGLDDQWARRVIEQVGNYAEIFDRNLGSESDFGMDRGPNRLGSDGGWFFPPPLL